MAQKLIAWVFGALSIVFFASALVAWFLGGLTNEYGGYNRSGQPLNTESLMEVGEPLYTILGIVHWSVILAVVLGSVGFVFLSLGGKILSKLRKKGA